MIYWSDRDVGSSNIYSYDFRPGNQGLRPAKISPFSASAERRIIYEQAGFLHSLDPVSGASTRLQIGIATDVRGRAQERTAKGAKWIRNGELSPSGARAVFEFRGEIVTVPAEKGDPRNLTRTPGAHERSPVCLPTESRSPISQMPPGNTPSRSVPKTEKDAPELCPRRLRLCRNAGLVARRPAIAFHDNARAIYVLDLEKGDIKKIGADYQLGGGKFFGLVARRKMAGLYPGHRLLFSAEVRLFRRPGQVFPRVRRFERRPTGRFSTPPASSFTFRLDRCRSDQSMVRPVQVRSPG